jgi:hypothetical protein
MTQAPLRSWLGTVVLSLKPLVSSRAREPRRLASSHSLAPPGYRNTWWWGRCELCTTFRQPEWNRGASLVISVIPISTYRTQLLPELSPQMRPQGLHGGHHREIPSQNCGGFSPTIAPSNPTEVPIIPYENLLCPPLSDRLRPPTQQRAQGLLSG